jgi:hypothetical protein
VYELDPVAEAERYAWIEYWKKRKNNFFRRPEIRWIGERNDLLPIELDATFDSYGIDVNKYFHMDRTDLIEDLFEDYENGTDANYIIVYKQVIRKGKCCCEADVESCFLEDKDPDLLLFKYPDPFRF